MPQILEINYVATVGWALPIRKAIAGNPVLVRPDDTWRNGPLSDLAFAIETRLMYLPQIITFVSDHISELLQELRPYAPMLLKSPVPTFSFQNKKSAERVLFGAASFVTESRSCFENMATFYRLFHQGYLKKSITKEASYDAVARSTTKDAWASDLKRIRGDLVHERALFLGFDMTSVPWVPIFTMNWRPGHFGEADRIELRTLAGIWEGLYASATAMREMIVGLAEKAR